MDCCINDSFLFKEQGSLSAFRTVFFKVKVSVKSRREWEIDACGVKHDFVIWIEGKCLNLSLLLVWKLISELIVVKDWSWPVDVLWRNFICFLCPEKFERLRLWTMKMERDVSLFWLEKRSCDLIHFLYSHLEFLVMGSGVVQALKEELIQLTWTWAHCMNVKPRFVRKFHIKVRHVTSICPEVCSSIHNPIQSRSIRKNKVPIRNIALQLSSLFRNLSWIGHTLKDSFISRSNCLQMLETSHFQLITRNVIQIVLKSRRNGKSSSDWRDSNLK